MSSPTPPTDETPCGVCSSDRAAHATLNHEFNVEGVLIPKKHTPQPLRRPPVPSDSVILRLINVLASKGILTEQDLGNIFPPAIDPHANPH